MPFTIVLGNQRSKRVKEKSFGWVGIQSEPRRLMAQTEQKGYDTLRRGKDRDEHVVLWREYSAWPNQSKCGLLGEVEK